MVQALLKKLFGTKNERELKRLLPIVDAINALEQSIFSLNDSALKEKTEALTKKLSAIADELYNPNLKTSQDSLKYLPKLDFQISGVGGISDGADAKPSAAATARHCGSSRVSAVLTRLIRRLNDELTRRIDEASITSLMKERLETASSFVKRVWNTELYIATETTVVDDRSIDRAVSVTTGKVVKALIILFIGIWIAEGSAR